MISEESKNIEQKVMSEIKSGRVHLLSKYVVLAEKLGTGSALILSVLLAFLFACLVLFYLKSSDNLGYLSFGNNGILAFLESFPYLLVASFIIVIFIAGFILKKTEITYKIPFGYIAVGLIVLIVAIGSLLDIFGVGERIEKESFDHPRFGFFQPFFQNGRGDHARGIAGRIVDFGNDYVLIQTPGNLVKIDLTKVEDKLTESLEKGLFIMVAGERRGDIFVAKNLKIINEGKMMMIRSGVRRHFGEFDRINPLIPHQEFPINNF